MANNSKRYWSRSITQRSNSLDLEKGVFTWKDPRRIAMSLKESVLSSDRRKASPFQSAMSVLNFYINRAGKSLPESQKEILNEAKKELRIVFKD